MCKRRRRKPPPERTAGNPNVSEQARISFEFFPPRTAAQKDSLNVTLSELEPLSPDYFSVTFGAGGSTLDATRETVLDLKQRTGVPVAPHISCMAQSEEMLHALLKRYRDNGIDRLVVLRGDRPDGLAAPGPFQYANELVAYIRDTFGADFHIEVACYPEFHPESESPASEMRYFKQKVGAGADGAVTQYFYNADAYFRFLEDCEKLGIDVPVTPGIMPITNYRQLARFSHMCGAEVPQWIRRRLEGFGDDMESLQAFGLDVVTRLCERLLEGGAPGLHIYTLNRAKASIELWRRLNG